MQLIKLIVDFLVVIMHGIFGLLALLFGKSLNNRGKYDGKYLSRFQRWKEINRRNRGVCVNGTHSISLERSLTHTLIVGGSGSGKSSTVIIPSIQRGESSFFVLDLDGSIYRNTSGHLLQEGWTIDVVNLQDVTQSQFFGLLQLCQDEIELKKIVQFIVGIAYPDGNADSQFWSLGAEKILFICCRFLQEQGEQHFNLRNLRYLLENYYQLEATFVAKASQEVFDMYKSFKSSDSKVESGHVSSALFALERLSNKYIDHLTSRNTIDFSMLCRPKRAIYFIVPERHIKLYSPIISCFVYLMMNALQENRSPKPVMLYLDEFASLGNLGADFELYSVILRRYNVGLVCAIQGESQLLKYGTAGAKTLLNGSLANKIYLPGVSLDLATDLSRAFGKTSVEITPKDEALVTDRELLTPTEIMQLPRGKVIYQFRNEPPTILKSKPFRHLRKLNKRSKMEPAPMPKNELISPELIPLVSEHDD